MRSSGTRRGRETVHAGIVGRRTAHGRRLRGKLIDRVPSSAWEFDDE